MQIYLVSSVYAKRYQHRLQRRLPKVDSWPSLFSEQSAGIRAFFSQCHQCCPPPRLPLSFRLHHWFLAVWVWYAEVFFNLFICWLYIFCLGFAEFGGLYVYSSNFKCFWPLLHWKCISHFVFSFWDIKLNRILSTRLRILFSFYLWY